MPTILNMVTEKEQTKALRYLKKKGVELILGDGVGSVEEGVLNLASGKAIPTYTAVWTAGVKANTDTADFEIEQARAGRLVANEFMEAKGKENVYVAGDLVYYEENGQPTPQIVQAAEQTGHTAAHNIIAAITGGKKEAFKGKYDGFMVSIGSKYGVAFLNNKFHLSGFLAMAVKHLINLVYFLSISSFYNIGAYLRHEFFDIKHKRNIFGGMTSSKGNNLWMVPLRVYFGSMWLFEGLKKAFGWFGTTSWLGNDIVFPFEWLKDPVSGASEAATEEVAHQIFALNYTYGEEPMQVLKEMPDWFEAIMKIMMPNQDVALFMQKMMTFLEIAIGLALIAGLFVWLISALTIMLVAMFSLSGMFYWVNMWFVPVAIALMNGAGRAFGLDYWVMPWIGNKLDRWIYGKPKHIYSKK